MDIGPEQAQREGYAGASALIHRTLNALLAQEAARLGIPAAPPLLIHPRKPCWHLSTAIALRAGPDAMSHATTLADVLRQHPDVSAAHATPPGFVNLRLTWPALTTVFRGEDQVQPASQAPSPGDRWAVRRAARFGRMVARECRDLPEPSIDAEGDVQLHRLIAALVAEPPIVDDVVACINHIYETRPLLRLPPAEVAAWKWLFAAAGAALAGNMAAGV